MRFGLLLSLAGNFYALGVWLHLRALGHLAPGVAQKDIAAVPGRSLGNDEGRELLASLYLPRGWQLRQLGMVSLLISVLVILGALFDLLF